MDTQIKSGGEHYEEIVGSNPSPVIEIDSKDKNNNQGDYLMKREDYLSMKGQLKELASKLRSLKGIYKDAQRECAYGKANSIFTDIRMACMDYRSGHIFMSMVRGKNRVQIESNFEEQQYCSWLEREIAQLCETYGFEIDHDEKMRVIGIKQHTELAPAHAVGA